MAERFFDFILFLPETALLVGALAVFVLSVWDRSYRSIWTVALLAAGAAVAASVYTAPLAGEPFFPGIYRVDLFSQLLKVGLALGLGLVLLLCRQLDTVKVSARTDTPLFLLLSTAGMMMLVSGTEMLTLYVALELSAYGLYVAVALHKTARPGAEAGVRYVLYGATASAVTLYGLSLIFGATGSTYIDAIARAYTTGDSGILILGLVLTLGGFFFKLAVFPFHFWAPDVYEGAPHQVVAFVGTLSKLGAIGVIARICTIAFAQPDGLYELFWVMGVASMTLGNLAALVQRDLKRLLAYSTVAHAGYLMLGYGSFSEMGLAAVIFYGLIYLVMAHLAFVVVCALGKDGSNPTLEGLEGLHRRSPALALMLLTAMFGLSGIPPTAGFVGKWFLFAAALQRGQFLLVLVAALNSTVALYYYLQVIRAAYVKPADGQEPLVVSGWYRVAGTLSLGLTLAAGVYPGPLWRLASRAASVLLGT